MLKFLNLNLSLSRRILYDIHIALIRNRCFQSIGNISYHILHFLDLSEKQV